LKDRNKRKIRLARCRGRGEAALLQLKNVRLRTAKFLKSDGRRLSLSGHPGSGACKQVHRAPAKPNNFDRRRNREEVLQLYAKIPEEQVDWSLSGRPLLNARPLGDPNKIDALVNAIAKARQPIILSGSGVIWSKAWPELQEFVEKTGIPFYTTPQGRGVVPDDHEYSYLTMRSTAFRDTGLLIVVGTRMNYIIGHAAPPRFNGSAKIARIDIDADEIATAPRKVDIGIVGDCKAVLRQLIDASAKRINADHFSSWRRTLSDGETAKRQAPGANKPLDETPIHPLRLCDEIKNFMQRDAILVVDGQEILNFGRQSMPTFTPGHRLNSGPFATTVTFAQYAT
jgi:thiamine pyrophosphate-dependent acetolactate synthase large subunit-like protein